MADILGIDHVAFAAADLEAACALYNRLFSARTSCGNYGDADRGVYGRGWMWSVGARLGKAPDDLRRTDGPFTHIQSVESMGAPYWSVGARLAVIPWILGAHTNKLRIY